MNLRWMMLLSVLAMLVACTDNTRHTHYREDTRTRDSRMDSDRTQSITRHQQRDPTIVVE